MAGKGSAPRPLSVSDEEFGKRFDAIDWSDLRTPENDEHVIDTLLDLRAKSVGETRTIESLAPDGTKMTARMYEVNTDMAAIDYAIGVMKATKP